MINYFSTLPRELEDAALVDGCTRLQVLVKIVLPLSVPGLVAAGLFAFIATWNNFLFAFLFTTTEATKTLPVIMRLFALGEPAVMKLMQAPGMRSLPVRVADVGAYPAKMLTSAFVFDHGTASQDPKSSFSAITGFEQSIDCTAYS
jgi:ABC-type nitrate/sulfonate/bicarbonate transport system permease component